MKIAVLCDLHLPIIRTAAQYAVLDWAVQDLEKESPDFVMVAGDVTADGELLPLRYFLEKIRKFPHVLLLGNSDIRDEFCRDRVMALAQLATVFCGWLFICFLQATR